MCIHFLPWSQGLPGLLPLARTRYDHEVFVVIVILKWTLDVEAEVPKGAHLDHLRPSASPVGLTRPFPVLHLWLLRGQHLDWRSEMELTVWALPFPFVPGVPSVLVLLLEAACPLVCGWRSTGAFCKVVRGLPPKSQKLWRLTEVRLALLFGCCSSSGS
jgi:hypothetical protein